MIRRLPHLTISACLLPALPLLASAEEAGFLEDAKASLLLRKEPDHRVSQVALRRL